jgi:3-hydroxybutyryl-CoA dehydrogenase
VDLVFEAVPERLDLKEDVLKACEMAAAPHAIIASNTSSFPIDELASFLERPERFLGMHWFNPPEWTPGVEVIPADVTDPAVADRTVAFLRAIGKRPALVKSGPGFVANRIQMALFREALACVNDGLASPEEVDEVVRSCFGFRLPFFGPFQIADMAGLDVYASVFETLEKGLGEEFHVPAPLRELVDRGRTGTKSGAGFLTYSDEERERLLLERDRRYAALNELLSRMPPLESKETAQTDDQV